MDRLHPTSDSPGVDSADGASPSPGPTDDGNDLDYARSVERTLNRAMSARTRDRIDQHDALLARKLAVMGSAALATADDTDGEEEDEDEDEDEEDKDEEGDSELSEHRPVTAKTKQLLDDESLARQAQMEMYYDLHSSSSKTGIGRASNAALGASGSRSPPGVPRAIAGSTSSMQRGAAANDLSVTGKAAAARPADSSPTVPSSLARTSQLGSSYQDHEEGGSPHAADLLADGTDSEALWDSEHDDSVSPEEEWNHGTDFPPINNSELEALFAYIDQFKPESVELDPYLKPFLPEYIPAIGDLEAMIKIPPPGIASAVNAATPSSTPDAAAIAPSAEGNLSFYHDLGITVLDEPSAKQSDPAVLHYQLKSLSKTTTQPGAAGAATVHSILATDPPKKLDDWIASTSSAEWTTARSGAAAYTPARGRFPPIDRLMMSWDDELGPDAEKVQGLLDAVTDTAGGSGLLAELNMPLADTAKAACALLRIPTYPPKDPGSSRALIDSLHALFDLYAAFNENQHFNAGPGAAVGNDEAGSGGLMF
ncbi:hypothetical protein AMAG_01725 [Allomyces macrogynus ATCC 38327]|uniref:Intraflagellar transport protein 46 n=1 Tax=Allomyces macrogynus (strain ATCC 38327) TaxID=578462 RepID=A0A0L0S0C7_ALLM3|nr:hypothetical protein AMAG_01725 [Allomyces macrogynus ATCC 38327]|eukprot:KNE55855.1 hypothetical protein AMAG_01725 [Allomyces macrogynus ATCC 38327]